MSETPETDGANMDAVLAGLRGVVAVDFARRLERERDALKARVAELESRAADITQEQANELQDILCTLTASGVALTTSAGQLRAAHDSRGEAITKLHSKLAAERVKVKELEVELLESARRSSIAKAGLENEASDLRDKLTAEREHADGLAESIRCALQPFGSAVYRDTSSGLTLESQSVLRYPEMEQALSDHDARRKEKP